MRIFLAFFLMFIWTFPAVTFSSEGTFNKLREGVSDGKVNESLQKNRSEEKILDRIKKGPIKEKKIPSRRQPMVRVLLV